MYPPHTHTRMIAAPLHAFIDSFHNLPYPPSLQLHLMGPYTLLRLLEPVLLSSSTRIVVAASLTHRLASLPSPKDFLTRWHEGTGPRCKGDLWCCIQSCRAFQGPRRLSCGALVKARASMMGPTELV